MTTYNLLREAVDKKLVVHGWYGGYRRAFCPHVLGAKDGITRCLAYQFGGQSSKGDIPEWRCFEVEKLSALKLEEGRWCTGSSKARQILSRTLKSRRAPACIDVIHHKVRLR